MAMNNDYEKLAEFISFINKQMAQTTEEKIALRDTLDKINETFKIKIGSALSAMEKDIEDGKITNTNTIQSIKKMRERYNTMFANNKDD